MNVSEAIRNKRAIRAFRDEPLSAAQVSAILDAGRRSQSSKNSQPWSFIAVQERQRLQAIAALGDNIGHVGGSALCVVIVVPQENERTLWHFFDTGQAAAYMQLAGQELGIGSCLGTVYDPDGLRELLGFPAEYQAQLLISFGFPAEQQPRRGLGAGGRRQFADVVHHETWGS
ncbi:MAG: nitroreductase family protein [Anaerolineae bacterium]|nr:nitroreductase family protein [Anaerolineae bacterium]